MNNKFISTLSITVFLIVSFVLVFPVASLADEYDYNYYDQYYHYSEFFGFEEHEWDEEDYDVLKMATLKSNGKVIEHCYICNGTRKSSFSWSLDEPDSEYNKSYNVIDHSIVTRKSKSITVELDNAFKGSIVKVKIGKKTYKKKVGKKKKIKLKIKKPKYGSKVTIKVYYKGRRIGDTYWENDDSEYEYENSDIVYYAKNIKKGMTKKQVKNLYYWGGPSSTGSSSGGWSYWYYNDGSYIGFKKGRVRFWYDAAR